MEQLPNILLASPVLLASIAGTYSYLRGMLHRQSVPSHPLRPAQHLALLPFHLHHLLLTFLLLFSSHTQIALRLSITNPVIWWNVASMAFDWSDEDVNANLDEPLAPQSTQTSEKSIREAPNGGSDPSVSMEKSAKTDYVSATVPRGLKGKLRTKKMTLPGKLWVGWTVVWSLISLILWSGHYPPA
jgi:phosphatidylinositol glycan class V